MAKAAPPADLLCLLGITLPMAVVYYMNNLLRIETQVPDGEKTRRLPARATLSAPAVMNKFLYACALAALLAAARRRMFQSFRRIAGCVITTPNMPLLWLPAGWRGYSS